MNIVGDNTSTQCKIQSGFPNTVRAFYNIIQMHTPDIELKRSVLVYNSNWRALVWNTTLNNQHTIIDIQDNGDTLPYKITGSDTVITGDGFVESSSSFSGIVVCSLNWYDGLYQPREPNNTNGLDVETKPLPKQIRYPIYLWHTSCGTTQSAKSPTGKFYSTYDKKVFLYIQEIDNNRTSETSVRLNSAKIYNCESSGSARFLVGSTTYLLSGKTDVAINNQKDCNATSNNVADDGESLTSDLFTKTYKGWRKCVVYENSSNQTSLKPLAASDSDVSIKICKQMIKIKYDTSSSLFIYPSSVVYDTKRVLLYNNEDASDTEVKTLSFYQYGCVQLDSDNLYIPVGGFGGFYDKWDTLHSSTPLSEKQRVVDVVRYEAYSRAVPFGRNDAYISAEETNKYATPQTFNTYCSAYDKYESFIPYNVGIPEDKTQNAYIYMSVENNFSEYDSDMYCADISESIGTDATYGKLIGVIECNGLLYCVQETALSVLDYNQRRVNNDLGGYRSSDIKRGDYQYLIKNDVIPSMDCVCATEFGLCVLTQRNTMLYLVTGEEVIDMTRKYGMQKYFKTVLGDTASQGTYKDPNVRVLYDELVKRLYIVNNGTVPNKQYSLVFDFTINSFVGYEPYRASTMMKTSLSSLGAIVIYTFNHISSTGEYNVHCIPDAFPPNTRSVNISSNIFLLRNDDTFDGTTVKRYTNQYDNPTVEIFVKSPTLDDFAQFHNVEVEAHSLVYNTTDEKYEYKQLDCPITKIEVWNDYGKGSGTLTYSDKPSTEQASVTKKNGRWIVSMPRFTADGNNDSLTTQQDSTQNSYAKVRPRISKINDVNDRPYGNYLFVRLTFNNKVKVRLRRIICNYDLKQL